MDGTVSRDVNVVTVPSVILQPGSVCVLQAGRERGVIYVCMLNIYVQYTLWYVLLFVQYIPFKPCLFDCKI